jgi:hypothetical protein
VSAFFSGSFIFRSRGLRCVWETELASDIVKWIESKKGARHTGSASSSESSSSSTGSSAADTTASTGLGAANRSASPNSAPVLEPAPLAVLTSARVPGAAGSAFDFQSCSFAVCSRKVANSASGMRPKYCSKIALRTSARVAAAVETNANRTGGKERRVPLFGRWHVGKVQRLEDDVSGVIEHRTGAFVSHNGLNAFDEGLEEGACFGHTSGVLVCAGAEYRPSQLLLCTCAAIALHANSPNEYEKQAS